MFFFLIFFADDMIMFHNFIFNAETNIAQEAYGIRVLGNAIIVNNLPYLFSVFSIYFFTCQTYTLCVGFLFGGNIFFDGNIGC